MCFGPHKGWRQNDDEPEVAPVRRANSLTGKLWCELIISHIHGFQLYPQNRRKGLKCSFSSRTSGVSPHLLWLILHSLSLEYICPSLCCHTHRLANKTYWNVSGTLGEILSCACCYKKSWKIRSFLFFLVLISLFQLYFPSTITPKKGNTDLI